MKVPTIFITYNPKSDSEQTLAVRLHTIGAVNGFKMLLPDRYNSESKIDKETKRRIDESDYFIMFSKRKLSNIVRQEIDYAYENWNEDRSKIIIIHESDVDLKIPNKKREYLTSLKFNSKKDNQNEFFQKIINVIQKKELENSKKENRKLREQVQALIALLAIGLGLFVLSTLPMEE